MADLPQGFVIDRPAPSPALPEGFSLDAPEHIGKAPPQRPGVGARLYGSAENVLSLITGGLLEAPAGVYGLSEGIAGLIRGDADPVRASVEGINRVRSYAPQPQTQAGQQTQKMLSLPFQVLEDAAFKAGSMGQDAAGGSPAAGAFARSAIEIAPAAIGFRTARPGFRQRATDVKALTQYADDVGFDMSGSADLQRQQIVGAAENLTGGRTTIGQDFDQIQRALQTAREVERKNVTALYDEARSTDAGVSVARARNFEQMARNALADFDVEDMPIVRRRLGELSEISTLPDNAIVKLNAVARYRQRLNRNQPAATDLSQQTALGILKGELDSFLESEFNANMITGDPQAVLKWRMANDAYRAFKEKFDANKTVRQLTQQQATPEQMRNWIFGANAVGAKKEAGQVVARIKRITGEDSPSMTALRQDALLDIMGPLLQEEPNFGQFVRNYDKFMRNNDTLANELFPDSVNDLGKLRAFAGAVEKDARTRINIDLEESLSRALFGHGIAQAAMKVSIANQAMKFMRTAAGRSEKTRIMGDILGYDPSAPLIPYAPAVASGAVQTAMQEDE